MAPQSETARKLFRILGRDPDGGSVVAAAAGVVVVRRYVADGGDEVSSAYAKYLRAVDAANASAAKNARLNKDD